MQSRNSFDISRHKIWLQVQNFIAGIKPIQSIIRIGAAAGQLLAIPAEALRGRPDAINQGSSVAKSVPVSRQLQRGIFGQPLPHGNMPVACEWYSKIIYQTRSLAF